MTMMYSCANAMINLDMYAQGIRLWFGLIISPITSWLCTPFCHWGFFRCKKACIAICFNWGDMANNKTESYYMEPLRREVRGNMIAFLPHAHGIMQVLLNKTWCQSKWYKWVYKQNEYRLLSTSWSIHVQLQSAMGTHTCSHSMNMHMYYSSWHIIISFITTSTTGMDCKCCPRTQLFVFANKALHDS